MSDLLKLENFLCFSIYSAGHAFNQFYRPLLDEIGLTYPQYLAMVSLWSQDDQTVKEIGQALSLESNTLTPLLKRLEALQLISRTRDPKDERQVRIRLTQQGKSLKQQAKRVPACVAGALGFSADELKELQDKMLLVQQRLQRGADERSESS
ncbi:MULTISPECIES: MarR family winged helix-turn-helix transcriptional regulator [unclassified Mesorhizobium]|uniref:MarR family winged helix-turn-helix transcriptional regulator n=1 Tax=unclassified Mesorhizobium TaxID=325217 RepID=UPI001AECDDFE|nr:MULTISPECIES: MarR family transcriptional regulator [unclassified Mesorhizobium]